MFCTKCGKELPEGQTFCDACGAQIEIPEQQVLTNETPAETVNEPSFKSVETPSADVAEQPETETPVFAEFNDENKPKKSKKKLIIALTSLVLAACIVLVTVFNLSTIKGFWIEKFGSDKDYFKYVEKKAFSEYANTSSKLYGNFIDTLGMDGIGAEAKVEFQLGDSALDLLKNYALVGGTIDNFDWLKNISYTINSNISDEIQNAGIKFNIGEGTLIDLQYIMDAKNNNLYFGILNLSDKFLKSEISETAVANSYSDTALLRKISNKLPSDKEYLDLVEKYIGYAIDCIGNVNRSSTDLTIGEYTQNVTVLKYKITEEDILNIAKKVLIELKNDKDFKNYITRIEELVLEEYAMYIGEDYKKGDLYKEFQNTIQDVLDEISSEKGSSQELLSITDYVNSAYEIIGRKFEIDSETIFEYASAYNGNNFAYEAKCNELGLLISGKGTDKNDIITATYSVKVEGQKLCDFKLENFDCGSLKDGSLNGSIEIVPSYEIISDLFDLGTAEKSIISMLKPSVKFGFKNSSKASQINIDVLSKSEKVVGLSISASISDSKKVSIPKDSATISIEEYEKYLDTIDLNNLVTALEKAKLPKELLDTVKETINYINEYGLEEFIEYEDYYEDYFDF